MSPHLSPCRLGVPVSRITVGPFIRLRDENFIIDLLPDLHRLLDHRGSAIV